MAKKKGGKGKKKLTPEEKKLKAQKLALKAEETRKKKEAEQLLRLKQLQEREERYTKENLVEIHAQWRKILRVSRTKELREEVTQLAREHDYQVERKNNVLASLFQELEESEAQHRSSFSKHLQVLDGLIDLHYVRTKDMGDDFEERLKILASDFNNEKAEMMRVHDKQKQMLNDMMDTMEAQVKEHEGELRHEYEASREEMRNKNMEEYNVLKISLENAIEDLERRLEHTHQDYLSSTETKTQAFKKMIDKDKVTARLIEQRMRKLMYIHDNISYWRAKIGTNSREWDGINKALRDQKDYVNGHYQGLKKKLLRFRNCEHERLKDISKTSEDISIELTSLLKLSQRIMRFGDVNSKLETEQEKIFPFDPLLGPPEVDETAAVLPDSSSVEATKKKSVTIADKPRVLKFHDTQKKAAETYRVAAYATDSSGVEVEEWNYLSRFQKRYNKVLLDKMTLDLEKKRVLAENMRLQTALQQYLDGITVNENALKGPMNTLMMVTPFGRAQA
ncbi:coiled-coil domain-containing protein 65 homolog [Selaginella moellendorffii]|uniref:coiled-coil domain-containing protein 65 homolog n=1 Tax=Selaginella moellendorffii TaxID=88036 RepID=UPI000D1C755D|nr:coiled-coil domain-containing protein 65 homolog [Selaginella moellendorffii]|eukprot:XP_024536298.1 coiled-coil domain-containing protein 65 homolog [Selaginella moellendorffii]